MLDWKEVDYEAYRIRFRNWLKENMKDTAKSPTPDMIVDMALGEFCRTDCKSTEENEAYVTENA